MKKPAVDYRNLRLYGLKDPRYSHLKLLASWPVFLLLFFLTERWIGPEMCFSVHCPLDNRIPFCEYFVIPYIFWYFLIALSLGYFLLYDISSFRALQSYILIVQAVAMVIYILFPSRQDLRPVVFPRENGFTRTVALLYSLDTNTGVCPSLHVAISLGIASVWLRKKDAALTLRTIILLISVLICLSTLFIKQHSAVDLFAAIPVCMLAEYLLFGITGRGTAIRISKPFSVRAKPEDM